MTATTIDVRDAQTQLMQLLTLALKGGDVVIAKDNVPLVRLVPMEPQKARTAGMHKGAVRMNKDFDAPLPEEFCSGGE